MKREQIKFLIVDIIVNKITNFTKNINKSLTMYTMKVSNSMVNKFKNKPNAQAIATNIMKDITVMATNGSTINSDAIAKLEMAAIINILSSNKQKNYLANEVVYLFKKYLPNDPKLKSQLQQAANLQQLSRKTRSFDKMVENMVNKFTDIVQNINKGLTSVDVDIENEIKKRIRQELETEINNTNTNINEIINDLSNYINKSFKNITEESCLSTFESQKMTNRLRLISGKGSTIKVYQLAKTDAIAKCISKEKIGNKFLKGLLNDKSYNSLLKKDNNIEPIFSNNKKFVKKKQHDSEELVPYKKIFGVRNNKIFMHENNLLSSVQKKILDNINIKGVYHIKISKEVLFKTLKVNEISNLKSLDSLNNAYHMIMSIINKMQQNLFNFGLYIKMNEEIISIYLPKLFLEKDNLENNINKFFDTIIMNNTSDRNTPYEKNKKKGLHLSKFFSIKFFTRLNRDNNGKIILANLIDSMAKLGILFFLPYILYSSEIDPVLLITNIEYFSNFIIENMVTLVSDKCRLNYLKKELLSNDTVCDTNIEKFTETPVVNNSKYDCNNYIVIISIIIIIIVLLKKN